jgi:hypothetical protein
MVMMAIQVAMWITIMTMVKVNRTFTIGIDLQMARRRLIRTVNQAEHQLLARSIRSETSAIPLNQDVADDKY